MSIILEAPTVSNVSTKFEPDTTSSFQNRSFRKIAKFIRQLSALNGKYVTNVDMNVSSLSHRIYAKVQLDMLNRSLDIVVFMLSGC